MTRRSIALALVAPLLLAACFRGSLPPRERYRLVQPPAISAAAPAGPLAGTLAVAAYQTPGLYGESAIVYRVGETEYGAYPSREWALPLGDQLGLLSEAVLRRVPVTSGAALYDPPSPRAHTFVWRGAVREFEEVNRGREVLAAVRLDATLVRSADGVVVWTGSVRLESAVPQPTMTAVVTTLSALAVEAVERLAADAAVGVSRTGLTRGQ